MVNMVNIKPAEIDRLFVLLLKMTANEYWSIFLIVVDVLLRQLIK